MRVLREGLRGKDVAAWQNFLRGRGSYLSLVDGIFGPKTKEATTLFQQTSCQSIEVDGIVGRETYAAAMLHGFSPLEDSSSGRSGPNWPPPPEFPPLTAAGRMRTFGKFSYEPTPSVTDSPEAIRILGGWIKNNIVEVSIPQLNCVSGAHGLFYFHKLAADRVKELFNRWEEAGHIPLVLQWGGSWVPRFIRGSRTTLSSHAFGSAFDINVPDNLLGIQPALVGRVGSVRELVPIANELGWWWGGHYKNRPDGMHFELAKL